LCQCVGMSVLSRVVYLHLFWRPYVISAVLVVALATYAVTIEAQNVAEVPDCYTVD